jgi:PAS domain S-box-containing protein
MSGEEWVLLSKSGAAIPVEISAMIHPDGRWVAFVRDITSRKRSEEALARAQEVARLGSFEWDLRTNHVERSREYFALLGVEPEAGADQPWSLAPYVNADDRDAIARLVEEAIHERRSYSKELRVRRADGAERILLAQGEPQIERGEVVRVVGTLLDVTERRRAEIAREETFRWFRAVFEHAPVGLVLLHPDGRIEPNERATLLAGPTQALDDTLMLDAAGNPIPVAGLPGVRALRGEHVALKEYFRRGPDGSYFPVLAGAAPISDAEGGVSGAVVAYQDISAAKELERLRAEWSSVVAHDLRQPLNGILLAAAVLQRRLKSDADATEEVGHITSAGKRLQRMIGDLMDLSRLEARRLELARQRTRLPPLVLAAVTRLQLEAPTRSVVLDVRGEIPEVDVDPDRVAQVVDNLLSNALKYGSADEPIRIVVEREGEHVAVAVTNAGKGIAADELPHLFQRFQRTGDARASRVKGIGLGLYITRELVEAHGGAITVTSTPGATTTFRFTLPTAN